MPECTTVDGVRIVYDDVGTGPAVALVHGITDERTLWAPIVERLSERYRCLALDLRGHGASGDAADYSSLSMANDVAAVVASARLDEPPSLIGHSLGGVVVTVFAATAPVAAVVNVDQPLRFSDFAAALAPLELGLRGGPEQFHDALTGIFTSMEGERLPAELEARLRARRAQARQEVVLGVWDLVFTTPPADLDATAVQLGSAVTAPYLSLHGLPLAPGYADWLRSVVPQAIVEEWAGDGHYLHLVEPDRFAERVGRFFAGRG